MIGQASVELKKENVDKCQEVPKTEIVHETIADNNIEINKNDDDNNELNEGIAEMKNDNEAQFEVVKSWWDGEEYELMTSKNVSDHTNVQPPKQMENHVNDLLTSFNAQKFFYFYQGIF